MVVVVVVVDVVVVVVVVLFTSEGSPVTVSLLLVIEAITPCSIVNVTTSLDK